MPMAFNAAGRIANYAPDEINKRRTTRPVSLATAVDLPSIHYAQLRLRHAVCPDDSMLAPKYSAHRWTST